MLLNALDMARVARATRTAEQLSLNARVIGGEGDESDGAVVRDAPVCLIEVTGPFDTSRDAYPGKWLQFELPASGATGPGAKGRTWQKQDDVWIAAANGEGLAVGYRYHARCVGQSDDGEGIFATTCVSVGEVWARVEAGSRTSVSSPLLLASATGTTSLAFALGNVGYTIPLVAAIAQDTTSGDGIVAPSGWIQFGSTAVSSNLKLYVYWRIAGTGTSSFENLGTQVFTPVSGAPVMAGAVYSFPGYGAPKTIVVGASTGNSSTASTSVGTSAFGENCRVLHLFANLDTAAGTPSAPLTALTGVANASGVAVIGGYEDQKFWGGTQARSATLPASERWAAVTLALPRTPAAHTWYEVAPEPGGGNLVDKLGGLSGGDSPAGSYKPIYGIDGEAFERGTIVRAVPFGNFYIGVPFRGQAVELYDQSGAAILDARDFVSKIQFEENDGFSFSTVGGYLLVSIQDASTTQTGVVSEFAQTFAGTKTFTGDVQAERHLGGKLSAGMTFALGAGAGGAGAAGFATGNDVCGIVSVTAGAAPPGGKLATVTFNNAFSNNGTYVAFTPANANAGGLAGLYGTIVTPAGPTGFDINCTGAAGLVNGTTYTFHYHVLGR